jgi:general secretion pathway protein D
MKNTWILICCVAGLAHAQPQVPGILRPPVSQPAEPQPELPVPVPAAPVVEENVAPKEEMMRPLYNGTALNVVIQEIEQRTGKVILRDPQVPDITVTLMSRTDMPVSEFLKAIESIFAMNNIAMVPFRDRFIKLVPADSVIRSGVEVQLDPTRELEEQEQPISQLVELKHLDSSEIQALITERLSPTAKVQVLERNNSFLITDTEANIMRVRKILTLLDKPAEVREEVKIYQLVHAPASEVKASLEALIQQSQENSGRSRTTNPVQVTTPRGVIRPGVPSPVTPTVTGSEGVPSPGLIRGNVQIVSDERTNILLIISRPENDPFFEEMIAALDKKVDPEITVRIYNLQFADAEEVSGTLNELIGAASSDSQGPAVDQPSTEGGARSGQSIREFIRQRDASRETATPQTSGENRNIGQLSESTRILADTRTNSLILMGKNSDLDVLESVIRKLDIMLAQVAVRAVIMEVNLNNNLSYGIDWLQRSLTVNNVSEVNGVKIREPVLSFAGGQNLSSNSTTFRDGAEIGRDIELSPGSLSYFTTLYDFNLDAVLRMAQGDSDAKVIATPIIVTTDNTEASIVVGERRAIPTTTATTIGGSIQSSFEYENIGLDLTVTPRINPQGVVIMEVTQSAENVGGSTIIDGNEVPIITTRQLEASVAIRSGGTLALGGLVREDKRESMTKVPILGSIPILGALFRSKSTETVRTELLVLLSPEVLLTAEEAEALTNELKQATELGTATWHRGWDEKVEEEKKKGK